MGDWMFDDGSAEALLNQDYGAPPVFPEPAPPPLDGSDPWDDPLWPPLAGDDDPTVVAPVVITGVLPEPPPSGGGGGGGAGGRGDWLSDVDAVTDGGGDLGPQPNRPEGWDDCEDREADSLAQEIKEAINNASDSDRTEYGSLIYRDADGNLQSTSLMPGTNGLWTPLGPNTQPGDFGLESWSQVVAIVHSHPIWRQGEDADGPYWVRVSPSDNHHLPNELDWA